MFLGRSKRPVNLGSRKQSSAHDALRNAEKQRSKRETQRRGLCAVQVLQAAFRARQLLRDGRMQFARESISAEKSAPDSEAVAYILPVLLDLPVSDQNGLVAKFITSGNDREYFRLLVKRLPLIWNHRPVSKQLCEYGFTILRHQQPPSIPTEVFESIMALSNDLNVEGVLEWAVKKDPANSLAVLLTTSQLDVVNAVPLDVLRPLFKISSLPVTPETSALHQLIARIATVSTEAWLLLSALVSAVGLDAGNLKNIEGALCNRKLVQTVAISNPPLQVAQFTTKLIDLFPDSRSDILLHLLLATSPSPLHAFWDAYKSYHEDSLLYIIVELFSYWLLVATDAELINNPSMGLEYDDLYDLATVVRDKAFDILWSKEPNKRQTLSDYETGVLKLLRQLYVRDSRRQLFLPGFWIMESRILGQDGKILDAVENGLFESTVEDEEDEDDDDNTSSTRLILKSSRPLRILEFAPFFIDFETRAELFYRCIDKERDKRRYGFEVPIHFGVNREALIEDAQVLFKDLGPRIKDHLRIQFISNGMPERGIDGGGLMKEFLMAISTEVFKEEPKNHLCPLFVETANHTLSPNPLYGEDLSLFTEEIGNRYFFLGQLIGKCLYENLLIDVEFASFFLAKWNAASAANSVRSTFDDLYLLDAELYNNMAKLHNIHGDDVTALGLDFTVVGSQGQEIQLRPRGAPAAVTDANKLEYMREIANYKLNTSLRPQTVRFLHGLGQIIRLEWLNMFNPKEINKLISGGTQDIDIEDLKRHTEVSGFEGHAETVSNFWKVLEELTPEQRSKFLKFVTSAPKGPLLGFDKLDPHFGIRCAGSDDSRLPTSSTCVNLLKLPAYSSIEALRQKLIYSIESGAGFDLS